MLPHTAPEVISRKPLTYKRPKYIVADLKCKLSVIQKVFGTHSEREIKRIESLVNKIEGMRPDMMEMSDEQLRDKTKEYKKRLTEGETLDDILPEAYATVREAARRVLKNTFCITLMIASFPCTGCPQLVHPARNLPSFAAEM